MRAKGKLWFRRKWYGWGWYPASWEGWACIAIYTIGVVGFGLTLDENSSAREVAFTFVLPVAILSAALIRVSYARGEKPRWQWGRPKDKD